MSDLEALQRESTMVNELNGLVAFVVGALYEIIRSRSLEDAHTCAEMGLAHLAERRAGLCVGPLEDPADWRKKS